MKQLTAQEQIKVNEHIDQIMSICGIPVVSIILSDLKKQLPEVEDAAFWDVIQKQINGAITTGFLGMQQELISLLNNPVKQSELREELKKRMAAQNGTTEL